MVSGTPTINVYWHHALGMWPLRLVLWYELYTSKFKKEGFKLNAYDLCVSNKTINDKQCFIGFWVDDSKISHEDPKWVRKVIGLLEGYFLRQNGGHRRINSWCPNPSSKTICRFNQWERNRRSTIKGGVTMWCVGCMEGTGGVPPADL